MFRCSWGHSGIRRIGEAEEGRRGKGGTVADQFGRIFLERAGGFLEVMCLKGHDNKKKKGLERRTIGLHVVPFPGTLLSHVVNRDQTFTILSDWRSWKIPIR